MHSPRDDKERAAAIDMEIGMLDDGIDLADAYARADPRSDASNRARIAMPRILRRYARALRERRLLG